MKEWTKIVSTETEPMRTAAWGGHIWWLTYPNVTGSPNLTSGIIDILPGQGHDRHCHDDTEEILFVLEGSGDHTYYCSDGSQKNYRVKEGDLMFMKAGQFHSTRNNSVNVLRVLAIYTNRSLNF